MLFGRTGGKNGIKILGDKTEYFVQEKQLKLWNILPLALIIHLHTLSKAWFITLVKTKVALKYSHSHSEVEQDPMVLRHMSSPHDCGRTLVKE